MRLGLGLLGAERQREGHLDAVRLQQLGVVGDVVPGLRRVGDAGLGEQLLVVEEPPGAGAEGHAVLDALVLAGLRERGGEVGLGGDGEQLVGAVELALGGVVGVRADLGEVGGVAVLDEVRDLLVDVGPAVDVDVDLDAGVLLLEGAGELVPVVLGAVGLAVAVVRRDQLEGDVAARREPLPQPVRVSVMAVAIPPPPGSSTAAALPLPPFVLKFRACRVCPAAPGVAPPTGMNSESPRVPLQGLHHRPFRSRTRSPQFLTVTRTPAVPVHDRAR